ncbi:unnamed protein product, partial [Didymodactylos carnosus]
KYPDNNIWLGQQNIDGEWPVAFHGTQSQAVSSITLKGLLPSFTKRDVKKNDAVLQAGTAVNRLGLYVATHCTGGADAYALPFKVSNGDKSEEFRVMFQCRVKPGSFTSHTDPVRVGEAWRIVDPEAVRPYGLLLKNETIQTQRD